MVPGQLHRFHPFSLSAMTFITPWSMTIFFSRRIRFYVSSKSMHKSSSALPSLSSSQMTSIHHPHCHHDMTTASEPQVSSVTVIVEIVTPWPVHSTARTILILTFDIFHSARIGNRNCAFQRLHNILKEPICSKP